MDAARLYAVEGGQSQGATRAASIGLDKAAVGAGLLDAIAAHAAGVLCAAVSGYSWQEAVGWSQLAIEAAAYREDMTLGPLLAAETVGATAAEVEQLAIEIEAKAAQLAAIRGAAVAARRRHSAAVRAMIEAREVSAAEVAAYDWSDGWPRLPGV